MKYSAILNISYLMTNGGYPYMHGYINIRTFTRAIHHIKILLGKTMIILIFVENTFDKFIIHL